MNHAVDAPGPLTLSVDWRIPASALNIRVHPRLTAFFRTKRRPQYLRPVHLKE
jgi:hypothetical protein